MNKAKKILITLVIVGIVIPVALSASYLLWMTSTDGSGGNAFLSGLFGPSQVETETDIYLYDSVYQSARALSDVKSPVYVLGSDILEDISPSAAMTALPAGAVENLYLPSAMRYEGIGLFVSYLDANNKFAIVKTTNSAAISHFDPQKPTYIFIHGMQNDGGAIGDERCSYMTPFLTAGYNVLLFRWSQLSDEEYPWNVEGKIWGTNKNVFREGTSLYGMRWRKALTQIPDLDFVEDDVPNASVAEIFGAYYLDFFTRFDYQGSSIEFGGHSMGGQVAFAAASFLLTKEQEGLVNPAYLPDKVTLFDPYITQFYDGAYCAWLQKYVSTYVSDKDGKPVYFVENKRKYTSSIDLMADIAKALKDRGIATQIIPAETGYVYLLAMIYDDVAYKKLCDNTVTIRYRSDWVENRVDDFNAFHMAGRNWYIHSILDSLYPDDAMNNSTDVSPSAITQLDYVYARIGTSYIMQENKTENDFTDDAFSSDNVENAKIAGFAFLDANDNGLYDERLQARMAGVKVELYMVDGRKNKLIATRITDESGYYSFDIARINANGFDKFFIRVIAPSGYEIGERRRIDNVMGNDIRQIDSFSETVTFAHYKNLKTVNIGLSMVDSK